MNTNLTGIQAKDASLTAAYQNDDQGRRVQQTLNGTVARYLYDGNTTHVIAETDASGAVTKYYTWSPQGQLLSLTTGGHTYYAVRNGHGDIVQLTDETGAIVAEYQYDAWGNQTSQSGSAASLNPYRYAGYRMDDGTGLYYLIQRYYDSSTGRFLSPDAESDMPDYTYAANNPLSYVDPNGHWILDVAFLAADIVSYYHKPSLAGAAWIAFDLLSTANPYGSLSMVAHGAKLTSRAAHAADAGRFSSKWAKLYKKAVKAVKSGGKKIAKGCNCFTAGTKVKTDHGEKNIEDIQVGDRVLSKDETTGEVAYKEVTATFNHETDEIYKIHVGGQAIEATYNHPFWVDGKGWTFVKDLKVGDLLVQSGGNTLKIDSIELLHKHVTVYNMTVDEFHTYFVSDLGIWVHNTKCSYKDITVGKSVRNISTNVTRTDFEKSLLGDGWKKAVSKDGKVTIYSKDGARYTVRDTSNQGQPTAEFWAKGATKVTTKIRLGD